MRRFAFLAIVMALAGQANADAKQDAINCLDKVSESYALASCEPAATIIKAARGVCGAEIRAMTHAVVNDPRYQSLPLEWRLNHSDDLVRAREDAMFAIVLETRIGEGKTCN